MLNALLHGKLGESVAEPQRLEDALTSTVFGTLVWLDAWDLLAQWLDIPYDSRATDCEQECWFWPRLEGAVEPDVLLRLGNQLVVVEAKYRSGRHDAIAVSEDDEKLCDQLFRQYRSIRDRPDGVRYAESLERAIDQCRLVQVYVVDARRQRHARDEWEQSAGVSSGAHRHASR